MFQAHLVSFLPLPGINHFPKEPWFLSIENGISCPGFYRVICLFLLPSPQLYWDITAIWHCVRLRGTMWFDRLTYCNTIISTVLANNLLFWSSLYITYISPLNIITNISPRLPVDLLGLLCFLAFFFFPSFAIDF